MSRATRGPERDRKWTSAVGFTEIFYAGKWQCFDSPQGSDFIHTLREDLKNENISHTEAIRARYHCLQRPIHIQERGDHFPISTGHKRIIKILIIQYETKYISIHTYKVRF